MAHLARIYGSEAKESIAASISAPTLRRVTRLAAFFRYILTGMTIPVWSLVTLLTELVVTGSVYFIIWKAYRTGIFLRVFAFSVLAYEALFNITYMSSRAAGVGTAVSYSPFEIGLAIFHGTFSIVMFLALVGFFLWAARIYKRGENFFLIHKKLTIIFVIAWGVSIISGLVFFVSLYLI